MDRVSCLSQRQDAMTGAACLLRNSLESKLKLQTRSFLRFFTRQIQDGVPGGMPRVQLLKKVSKGERHEERLEKKEWQR
jgi:hypothetical protein